MRLMVGLMVLGMLTACGVDGPPVPPNGVKAAQPGATVSGEASLGVTVSK